MIDVRAFAILGHANHGRCARRDLSDACQRRRGRRCPDPARRLYLVPSAEVRINGAAAGPGDGVAIIGEEVVRIEAMADAELVLVDAALRAGGLRRAEARAMTRGNGAAIGAGAFLETG